MNKRKKAMVNTEEDYLKFINSAWFMLYMHVYNVEDTQNIC